MAEHQKARSRARFLARGKAPKSTVCGTMESTKKHNFWHEGEHQKARSRARFLARGRAPKSTIFGTRDINKKHDFVHEGEHQKARSRARFLARGRAPKSTIFGTRDINKKHDFVHEGEHQKARSRARFFARGKAPKSTILCTKENTQNNVRPKYKEILFLTVTATRTDSTHIYINTYIYIPLKPMVTPFKVKRNQTAMIPLPPWCINSRCS